MGQRHLAVLVLQADNCRCPAARRGAALEARGVLAELVPRPPASTPIMLHGCIVEERMKQADGIGAAADAGDERIGQAAFRLQNLARALPRR